MISSQVRINPTKDEIAFLKGRLFHRWKTDPVFFVEHALGHYTWSKQREILESVRDNERTAVRACHGSSKTFTAAELTVWFLNTFSNSKVITSAPTFPQVKMLLWKEINKIYQTSRIELNGNCLTTEIHTDDDTRYAIGFSTDKPARAEGWHAPQILFILDEAKGIPQWLYTSVRGLMTGGLCRWLVISTTDGVEVGEEFHRIFEKENNGWHKIHISAEDSPYCTGEKFRYIELVDNNLLKYERKEISPDELTIQIATPKYVQDCASEWGVDSPLFLTKVKGELVDSAADTVIKLSQVSRMFDNIKNEKFDDSGKRQTGVDVARGGDDSTVFFRRKGLKVIAKKVIATPDLPPKAILVFLADELERFMEYDKQEEVVIDDTGVGGGLTDIMQSRKYNVIPLNFGGEPNDKDKYVNAISEIWYEVAKKVHEIACAEDARLQRELINRKGKLDKKGRRVVESKDEYKKRGFSSPDVADAFLLAFAEAKRDKAVFLFTDKPVY